MPSAWQRNKAMLSLSCQTVSVFLLGITAVHRHPRFWLLFSSKKKKIRFLQRTLPSANCLGLRQVFNRKQFSPSTYWGLKTTEGQRLGQVYPALSRPDQDRNPLLPISLGTWGEGGSETKAGGEGTSVGGWGWSGMSGESTECKWEGPWGRLG